MRTVFSGRRILMSAHRVHRSGSRIDKSYQQSLTINALAWATLVRCVFLPVSHKPFLSNTSHHLPSLIVPLHTFMYHLKPQSHWMSDRASRAMAYVGITRARDENHLAIYPSVVDEADQHHRAADAGIHQMHRGTKYAAAHVAHAILTANDNRARTMHTVAALTDRKLLPAAVAALLDRNDQTLQRPRAGLAPAHRPNPRSRRRLPTTHHNQTSDC
jgi:hypothetical protein